MRRRRSNRPVGRAEARKGADLPSSRRTSAAIVRAGATVDDAARPEIGDEELVFGLAEESTPAVGNIDL
jgi:hypothetical protein